MADDGGLSRFQQRMRAIPEAVRRETQDAVVASANEIAGAMRRFAPVDTGALRDSITVTPGGHSTPPYSQPGGEHVVPANAAKITVGDEDVRYPHLVEYGTTKTAPRPFFWPGFRLYRKRAASRIKRAMSKAIRKNWGKP